MVNHRYGVCVRMALGYCSIEWSQVDRYSFSVSGDTGSLGPDIIGKSHDSTIFYKNLASYVLRNFLLRCLIVEYAGTDLVAESGANCTNDFVIIPDPTENGTPVNADRFCGNGFITKICEYNRVVSCMLLRIATVTKHFGLTFSEFETVRALCRYER